MKTRILHCSTSLENYYLCLHEQVAGFINRLQQSGDLVYLAVKVGKKTYCGARFNLDEPTDNKPWADAENYATAYTIKNIEYCQPFDISFLSQFGGKYWVLKYVQISKDITDVTVLKALDAEFAKNKTAHLIPFQVDSKPELNQGEATISEEVEDIVTIEDEKELTKVEREIPDVQVSIMGTFQTIHFSNESDKIRGLEKLVNDNFYSLFPQFPQHRTLLIPENRLFLTKGFKVDGSQVQGIRTIPDGLLIVFDKKQKNPFQINLIEYECYGEKKTRETDKSNYLNSNIIPQLMRFASAFSIITDDKTRENTIRTWVDKTIDYINSEEERSAKVIGWVKNINPSIKERSIEREIEKLLIDAFITNLRVMLVFDELSSEQKSTIKNVVSSFRLPNGDNVQFAGYVVRLVQKINIIKNESEFALTIQ